LEDKLASSIMIRVPVIWYDGARAEKGRVDGALDFGKAAIAHGHPFGE
jgi:hypothetical protein